MAEGGENHHETPFDSGMFKSKFIHCCVTSTYAYIYYTTMLDSCHIDFFIDMEINEDFLGATDRHAYIKFTCGYSCSYW